MTDVSRLGWELDKMDQITAKDRSVASCEALWDSHGAPGISWTEAYIVAKQRCATPGADRQDGRTVAFLEGLMAATALNQKP